MEAVYNDGTKDVSRPVVCTSDGKLIVSGTVTATTGGLTDAQLRATAVPVQAQVRTCLGVARLTVPTANAVTLVTATGGIAIPVGAVTAELQADGGTVRLRRDGTDPTSTVGYRLDDGAEKIVDSTLSSVKIIATVANTFCNVAYFDRV